MASNKSDWIEAWTLLLLLLRLESSSVVLVSAWSAWECEVRSNDDDDDDDSINNCK